MKWRARSMRSRLAMPVSSSGKATLSVTLRQGKVDSSWNTMPIDLCGPLMVSPATLTLPCVWLSRPPITLNKVDLPQPDGPITDRNSPGLTPNETSSTAVSMPSGVSKRTTMSSTFRIASTLALESIGLIALFAFLDHLRGGGCRIAGLDPHVDDGNLALLDRGDSLLKYFDEVFDFIDRAEALRALRARHGGEIDIGLGNALADPAVFDRPVADTGDAFLMQFVVEEGAIIGDHDQKRNVVMRRCPERGDAHEEIPVAADRDRQPPRALERQRRAYRNAGPAADAAAAVGAEIVERVLERPGCPVPRQ